MEFPQTKVNLRYRLLIATVKSRQRHSLSHKNMIPETDFWRGG